MEETTLKPLYIRINEKRTVFGNDEMEKHYTSLAVNNLAPLAEALDNMIKDVWGNNDERTKAQFRTLRDSKILTNLEIKLR